MMPHDDSDLRLLERDLGRIARPRDGDERIRLAVREQLAGRMRPRPRRRLSVRIAIGSTALAGATAAIALVVLVATNGSEGPAVANAAIVHHALKAVTPLRHKVLHVKVVGVQNGVPVMAETWQETSAPYAIRGIKGGGGHVGEFGDNGTTSFRYDAGSNTIYEHPDSSHLTFTDPISRVRHELASGQAHVAGTVVIHGTSLYKIDCDAGWSCTSISATIGRAISTTRNEMTA